MALRRERWTLSVGWGSPSEDDSAVTCRQPRSGGWAAGAELGSRVTARARVSRVRLELSIE